MLICTVKSKAKKQRNSVTSFSAQDVISPLYLYIANIQNLTFLICKNPNLCTNVYIHVLCKVMQTAEQYFEQITEQNDI